MADGRTPDPDAIVGETTFFGSSSIGMTCLSGLGNNKLLFAIRDTEVKLASLSKLNKHQ